MKKALFFALLLSLLANAIQYWIIQHTATFAKMAKIANHFEDLTDIIDSTIQGLF